LGRYPGLFRKKEKSLRGKMFPVVLYTNGRK